MSLSESTVSTKFTLPDQPGRISKTVNYFAGFVGLGMVDSALGATLLGLAENTRTDLSEISVLFVARSAGYLLGALLGGRLYDRLPGHWVMAGVIFTMALMLVLTPLMPLLWLLATVLLLLGMAQSTLDVGGNTLLVWVHRAKVGPYMNGLHLFWGLGATLSPIIISQAISISGGITWAYWLLALLILPVAVWVMVLPSPSARTMAEESPTASVNHWLVALISLFFFLFVGAEISFGGWIFSYAVVMDLANPTSTDFWTSEYYLNSAYWGALTVGRLVAIPLAIRFRPRFILSADLIGCLLSVAVILAWPSSLTALWIGSMGVGFWIASIFPTMISLAARHLTVTGQVTGWFIVGASLGSMIVPWLIGQFFESVGPRVMMLTILGDLILAVLVFIILIYRIELLPHKVEVEN
jgi:FHS family Na+ dependent glucose MFS transporter 1